MTTSQITDAMKAALKWLLSRNGDGVFDRTNCLTAAGERAGVRRSTWSRLQQAGLVEPYAGRRLRVTAKGRALDLSGITESDTTPTRQFLQEETRYD